MFAEFTALSSISYNMIATAIVRRLEFQRDKTVKTFLEEDENNNSDLYWKMRKMIQTSNLSLLKMPILYLCLMLEIMLTSKIFDR